MLNRFRANFKPIPTWVIDYGFSSQLRYYNAHHAEQMARALELSKHRIHLDAPEGAGMTVQLSTTRYGTSKGVLEEQLNINPFFVEFLRSIDLQRALVHWCRHQGRRALPGRDGPGNTQTFLNRHPQVGWHLQSHIRRMT